MKNWSDRMTPLSDEFKSGESPNPKLAPQQFSISELFLVLVLVALVLSSQSSVNRFTLVWYGMMVLSNLLGPTFFLMNGIRFLRWRIHPSTVEFFENGVAVMDMLVPWLATQSSAMVWLDEALIERLLAFSIEKQNAKI